MSFWRFFGLIFWSFRLHSNNFTAFLRGLVPRQAFLVCARYARGVDANLFGVFRFGLRNIKWTAVIRRTNKP